MAKVFLIRLFLPCPFQQDPYLMVRQLVHASSECCLSSLLHLGAPLESLPRVLHLCTSDHWTKSRQSAVIPVPVSRGDTGVVGTIQKKAPMADARTWRHGDPIQTASTEDSSIRSRDQCYSIFLLLGPLPQLSSLKQQRFIIIQFWIFAQGLHSGSFTEDMRPVAFSFGD